MRFKFYYFDSLQSYYNNITLNQNNAGWSITVRHGV